MATTMPISSISSSEYLKMPCCHTYRLQPCNGSHIVTPEDNLSGPIRTGHNQHTHTGHTRQPELNLRVPRVHLPSRAQLEGCHFELNSWNATCLTPIPSSTQGMRSELNSRNTSKSTFETPLYFVDHAPQSKQPQLHHGIALRKTLGTRHIRPPVRLAGDAYCLAHGASETPTLQLSPSGTTHATRRT
ncbi:hypothetical protein DEO72_LG1g2102 [Vigna unguiculata]|uniref:Uncharacterized protein n=1 Tax=Vigna unguiculata TaxID=3917 RepID=A0A4D6KTG5_VIGUN|nr:hypothetical protein DEO72_LG1g2102 [Vigna unguiculata]